MLFPAGFAHTGVGKAGFQLFVWKKDMQAVIITVALLTQKMEPP